MTHVRLYIGGADDAMPVYALHYYYDCFFIRPYYYIRSNSMVTCYTDIIHGLLLKTVNKILPRSASKLAYPPHVRGLTSHNYSHREPPIQQSALRNITNYMKQNNRHTAYVGLLQTNL